jgi:hypothetical protein
MVSFVPESAEAVVEASKERREVCTQDSIWEKRRYLLDGSVVGSGVAWERG